VDLTLTGDQDAMVDLVAGFLARESPPAVVRDAEPLGHDPELWARAVEIGLAGLGAPEALGGSGASVLDLALVAELVGRHLAPLPFVDTTVATRLLAACGDTERVARAVGGAPCTIAVRPPADGTARLVPSGAVADAAVVLDGDALVLVAAGRAAVANVAAAPLADLPVEHLAVLATGAEAVDRYRTAVVEWRALTAAWLHGLAARSLALGVEYAKQRQQFGRPIGAFQALAHRLADDATDVQGLELLTRKAAWAVDELPGDADRLTRMAYAWAGEVANRVSGNSLHLHGGYGFMLEYDVQLYFRRAKLASVLAGDPRRAFAVLGRGAAVAP
jgi:alkylation response protein AidB-like acyl-CoA dehydrogenase